MIWIFIYLIHLYNLIKLFQTCLYILFSDVSESHIIIYVILFFSFCKLNMSKTILKNYLPAGNGEKVEDIIKNLNQ